MPYILNKTNGLTLATVQDASIDTTTDLSFVGRNYSGYGKIVDQNFVYLLENFANTTPPTRPVQGQLWFDSKRKILNYSNDGSNFKQLANLSTSSNTTAAVSGDLFWDPINFQLSVYNGTDLVLIGPQNAVSSQSYWLAQDVPNIAQTNTLNIFQSFVGSTNVAVISNTKNLSISKSYDSLGPTWTGGFAKGITLAGADPVTGSSAGNGYYFWGTAAESLTIANGSAGQLIYQSDIGKTEFVSLGKTGDILISQGTASPTFVSTSSVHVGYADTANTVSVLKTGLSGQILVSQGTSGVNFVNTGNVHVGISDVALSSSTATNAIYATNILGGSAGSIPIQTGTNSTSLLPIGGANTVLHSDGTIVKWVRPSTLGINGLASRVALSGITNPLRPMTSTNLTIVGFKGYALYAIGVSSAAWVTVYSSVADRISDSDRTIGVAPASNSGIIAEIITTDSITQYFTPAVYGYNSETTVSNNIQLRVYNNSNSTVSIKVTLILLQLEF